MFGATLTINSIGEKCCLKKKKTVTPRLEEGGPSVTPGFKVTQ